MNSIAPYILSHAYGGYFSEKKKLQQKSSNIVFISIHVLKMHTPFANHMNVIKLYEAYLEGT